MFDMSTVPSASHSVSISDEVLCRVAAIAARDVDGVVRLAGERSLANPLAEPVVIRNLGGAISANVSIVIGSGSRAAAVAKQVQEAVKQGIQDMTGVTAVHVNVRVTGMEADE